MNKEKKTELIAQIASRLLNQNVSAIEPDKIFLTPREAIATALHLVELAEETQKPAPKEKKK